MNHHRMHQRAALMALALAGLAGSALAQSNPSAQAIAVAPVAAAGPSSVNPDLAGLAKQEIRARLTPRRYATLAAEIGAKIESLPVLEGGAFKPGQLLVVFDCSIQQAQLEKALAEQAGAERTLASNLELEKLNSVGRLELDLSRNAVQRARAEVNLQSAQIDKCRVHAPYGGRVAEQKVREKQFVQPGQAMLDVIDDSVLELEFIVPSRWLSWIKVGGAFKVAIDETGRPYPARFTRIGARIDAVSQSVKVTAAINGRYPELMAGMSGRIDLDVPPAR